jgi:hypothetical protein
MKSTSQIFYDINTIEKVVAAYRRLEMMQEHQEAVKIKFKLFLRQHSPLPILAGFLNIIRPG